MRELVLPMDDDESSDATRPAKAGREARPGDATTGVSAGEPPRARVRWLSRRADQADGGRR